MAIAFLAVSRSQKASVTVIQDQNDARLMVDTALTRAQAEAVSRMLEDGRTVVTLADVNAALDKANAMIEEETKKITGGMSLPGM